MGIDEHNFIAGLKKRDQKALEFVVDHYSNLVFKVVGSVLNHSFYLSYVEECSNDVFWAVWNHIDRFDEEKGEFKNWIAAIAKYKAIDYKRKVYKESAMECVDDYDLNDHVDLESLILSKENKKELLSAINTMNEADREILIRRYFFHEKIESIAAYFGVDRNWVDQRLSRGRKTLRKNLVLRGDV
ncbi:RNA polymerase sigma-70 factor (ECF subfamily) [Oikeobacillus pervagus]|uniref:RNA polymerase sigma-70 factor (ECF subfamily) n=1 Tax=Oikeobacillus pervagus TaxID=1325931 RepID=A0AAJ1SWS7_9BACI|nr:sigma-70 family RNA polymerase sigma factor [Oikeobacillus pervagus]MDQ0214195.1 RNA polymerase sigma-70 factor (ECF subfamily) [Oikeobacillus pervagus]